MKTVLITGLNGFTGRHLHKELSDSGYNVVGLTAPSQFGEKDLERINLMDASGIRRSLEFHRPDFIIHLAGISFAAHSKPQDYYAINVIGTENILRATHEILPSAEKVIVASSGAVYGNTSEELLDESLCPKPVNHYTFSKLAMEHLVSCWFDRLNITIVRPFNYFGRGQNKKFLVPKIISHFTARKNRIELGNLKVFRDFSDVRDICRYYRLILTSATEGITLNLCSGTSTSLQYILDATSEASNHVLEVVVNPDFVRKNEILRLKGCTRNLYTVIGPQTRRSLKETINWMLEE